MSEIVDGTKLLWDIVKDGQKVSGKIVHVVPNGKSITDFSDWKGPVSVTEDLQEFSSYFGEELANWQLTTNWRWNGQFIANFNVIAEGTVAIFSAVDINVETLGGIIRDDGVAELPYQIAFNFKNITGGNKRRVLRGVACGDGSGRSGD
jgi:hypothetical protein